MLIAIGMAVAFLYATSAAAVGLGELETRSYLGEPLHVRIGIITQEQEEIDPSCFAVVSTSRDVSIVRKDVRLTLIETRNARYLEIRGNSSFNEPIGTISVRAACKGEAGVVRDYPILLDPAPLLAPPVVTGSQTLREVQTSAPTTPTFSSVRADDRASVAAAATDGATGRWTVFSGDTLSSIARGIYPGNRARQTQYIAALRQLNPELSGIGNDTPLYPNSQLTLPDLKALSARAPAARTRVTDKETSSQTTAQAAPRRPRIRATPSRPSTILPSARGSRVAETAKAPVSEKSSASAEGQPVASGDSFRLRISGNEVDLSRSKGITEQDRAVLRERLTILDADDQTAQILALKNTVKQIEKRLNEMQLKMAMLPPVTERTTTPATSATAPAPATATPPSPSAAPQTPPAPSASPIRAKPVTSSSSWLDGTLLGIPVMWLVGALSILTLAAIFLWSRRRRTEASSSSSYASPTPIKASRAETPDEFNKWANETPQNKSPASTQVVASTSSADASGMTEAERSASMLTGARKPKTGGTMPAPATEPATATLVSKTAGRFAADGAARAAETASLAGTKPSSVASMANAPRAAQVQPTPAKFTHDTFDLDATGTSEAAAGQAENTTDQTFEDRMRRLRYMQERYPELGARTVSIDEPDSMINAARLYYEENQFGKACELLTYAVEERPQEIRYWLAQFELFRLEKMAPQFSDLATKFQVMLGHTDAWPKVRQIGYALDPAHPLFAAARNDTDEERFDPMSENWLNAPLGAVSSSQSISHALVADLRGALFREHAVAEDDFASIVSRATSQTATRA
jgi:hypothetical protein